MRNQDWESKVIQKLLETHVQETINIRKETNSKEIDETIRGVIKEIKEFRQAEETTETCESWQLEIHSNWNGLMKAKEQQHIYIQVC
jgi:hypothetical protein